MNDKERELLLIISSFEEKVKENFRDKDVNIDKISFFEKIKIPSKMGEIEFSNVFTVTTTEKDGNISISLYKQDGTELIKTTLDSNGNFISSAATEELQELLDEIDLNKVIKENEKEEKVSSEPIKDEEVKQKPNKEDEEEEEEEKEKKEEENEKDEMEKDLKEELGEDLEIYSYRKIKDENFNRKMKEYLVDSKECGIAYTNKRICTSD